MFNQGDNFYLIGLNTSITCFAGNCLEIIGKSYMLITSGSLGVKFKAGGSPS